MGHDSGEEHAGADLAVLRERLRFLQIEIEDLQGRLRAVERPIQSVEQAAARMESRLSEITGANCPWVTQKEFLVVRLSVYGAWGLIGTAVLGAIVALVVQAAP